MDERNLRTEILLWLQTAALGTLVKATGLSVQ